MDLPARSRPSITMSFPRVGGIDVMVGMVRRDTHVERKCEIAGLINCLIKYCVPTYQFLNYVL